MKRALSVLVVEDSEDDAELMVRALQQNDYDVSWQRVDTEVGFRSSLNAQLDVVLCDYRLPSFDALRALQIVRECSQDLPFIIVSGTIGEDVAVAAINQGAADYLLKDRMARLGPAVARALEQRQLRTEKRLADQRLRASERRFRALIEHSADLVLLSDATGTILYLGPSLSRLLGYAAEEFLGRPIWHFIHPEDLPRVQASIEYLLGQPGATQFGEYRLRHQDGRYCWLEQAATNLLAEPDVEALVLNYRDISDRKQAEEALRRAHDELDQRVTDRTAELSHTVAILEIEVGERQRAEERWRAEASRTASLVQTAARLNAQLDLEAVLRAVCEESIKALAAPAAMVLLYDEQSDLLNFAASCGALPPEAIAAAYQPVPYATYKAHNRDGSTPLVVPDLHLESELPNQALYRHHGVRTLAHAAMVYDGKFVGQLSVAAIGEVRHFDDRELALLRGLADQAALALSNAREVTERLKAEAALADEKRRLELLYDLSRNLATSLLPKEVAKRALAAVMAFLGATRAEVFLLKPEDNRLWLIAAAGYPVELEARLKGRRYLRLGESLPGLVAQTRLPAIAPDLQGDEHWLPLPGLDDEMSSAATIPLLAGEELVGVVNLLSEQAGFFDTDHLPWLQAVATPLALSLQNARLFEAEKEARQVADMLRAANLALSEQLNFDAILETMLDHLETLIPYDSASVLVRENDDRLAVYAVRGYERWAAGEQVKGLVFEFDEAENLRQVVESGQTLIIGNVHDYSGWLRQPATAYIQSWLGVPLLSQGEVVGIFSIDKAEPHFFTQEHLRLVEAMAGQAAVAVRNALLYEQVRSGREQLRSLAHQVVTAQEDERYRLSFQLHEDAGQILSALHMHLSLIRRETPPENPSLRRRVREAAMLTGQALEQIRQLAQALRPPALNVVGLNLTLEQLCYDWAARTSVAVNYFGSELAGLPDSVSISFYRFLQEALNNIAEHAGATAVEVKLRFDGEQVSLSVRDNGRGFDVPGVTAQMGSNGSLGLLGLQERFSLLNGRLRIESESGRGTRLLALVPWQPSDTLT
jgi:PAS domain S-box-containing protein